MANDKIHDLGLSTEQKCISAEAVVYALFNRKRSLTKNESHRGMVRPIANKDVITTKVSGDTESSKQEPFPQSIAAPPAHSLSAALLPANNTDTFSLTDTYKQMCQ